MALLGGLGFYQLGSGGGASVGDVFENLVINVAGASVVAKASTSFAIVNVTDDTITLTVPED